MVVRVTNRVSYYSTCFQNLNVPVYLWLSSSSTKFSLTENILLRTLLLFAFFIRIIPSIRLDQSFISMTLIFFFKCLSFDQNPTQANFHILTIITLLFHMRGNSLSFLKFSLGRITQIGLQVVFTIKFYLSFLSDHFNYFHIQLFCKVALRS